MEISRQLHGGEVQLRSPVAGTPERAQNTLAHLTCLDGLTLDKLEANSIHSTFDLHAFATWLSSTIYACMYTHNGSCRSRSHGAGKHGRVRAAVQPHLPFAVETLKDTRACLATFPCRDADVRV